MNKLKKGLFIALFALEVLICAAALIVGLFGIDVSFIDDTRMAVVILGAIGMMLCIPGIICFVKRAPFGILSISGYLLGALALFTFFVQLFKLDVPFFGNPQLALVTMAAIIVLKGFIGCRLPAKKEPQRTDNTDFPKAG